MSHIPECEDDSDHIPPNLPLMLFLSFLLILALLYVIYLNIIIFKLKKRKKSNEVYTQCNLIKLQQITIHPDESINMMIESV